MDVGIDLTRISRFENRKEHFIKRILSSIEYEEFISLNDSAKPKFLAVRWAVKEAIFKATQDMKYLEYTLLKDERGKPYIKDNPNMKVSITHEGDYVNAIVIVG